ncbi:uncharacterized protein [Anoplolepis gracilipes]|uniref:uncharacterized protein n=1 Tax=Anoplolepis gracilipes TaxID=354296 RepID=UPI003BA2B651
MVSISTRGGKLLPLASMMVMMLTIGYLSSAERIDTPIPCGNTSDCRSTKLELQVDAFCTDGYCMCPNVDNGVNFCSSFHVQETKISGPLFYRTCKLHQDCKYMGGFCNKTISQCDCVKDYVPATDKQHCVRKVRAIGAACTDENQCSTFLANTTCENEKCVCISGYHYVEHACWRKAGYRRPCRKNQECSHIEGVICANMICECASGTVLNMDGMKCLTAAMKIEDDCVESAQCSATFANSLCLDKKCQCESGYHYEHELTRCFPNKALDDECANNYYCYQAEDYENNFSSPIKSVMCEANRCTCVENFVRQEDKCVSAGSSLLETSIIVSVITLLCSTLLL